MSGVVLMAALAGAGSALWLFGAVEEPGAPESRPATLSAQRPAFALPDLDGHVREAAEWDGKVVLLNFWATWCPPCRREMPLFADLQQEFGRQGFQVVAVAIDEAAAVREFAAQYGLDFPLLVGDEDAIRVAQDYGNLQGALPFSVLYDRRGRVVARFKGEISRSRLAPHLGELL
ncbi:MAG: TlpA disulfide reductase family protein [Gammaproteobacteria bacterium]|nr:TlpA disulfide reductase family protein [Gammaproteobacteria bacterium]